MVTLLVALIALVIALYVGVAVAPVSDSRDSNKSRYEG